MQQISNKSGSYSQSETSWEAGCFGTNIEVDEKLIKQANSISIFDILKYYKVNFVSGSNKIICPFFSHRGGREKTPSFNFYTDTNSFWCFGCSSGSKPVDFVSKMDGCPKSVAASKILEIFSENLHEEFLIVSNNFHEKLLSMMKFSNDIRKFKQLHQSEEDFKFVEKICQVYDSLNEKYELNDKSITVSVDKLLELLNNKYV